jgi:hypothetical protein
MTIKQYQKLAQVIAKKIETLDGSIDKVRYLKAKVTTFEIGARDPKKDDRLSIEAGDSNVVIKFNSISNPNNPNARFRTLKPGSISLYDKDTDTNVDASDFNFDSSQFADLLDAIQTEYAWEISY